MSTSQTIMAPSVGSQTADPPPRRSVFGNLLRKELLASRGAIIAGLAIFWLMPALWEMIYYLIDPAHELLFGFAWGLLACAGWLYAIVVGAHTVCRDWGKAEERFLLAQPVAPRTVIWAKLLAGAIVVFAVAAGVGLWDLCLSFIAGHEWDVDDVRTFAILSSLTAGTVAVGYAVAFAGAVATRQMLASVLVAALVLLMWMVAPMLSARLSSLQPAWNRVLTSEAKVGGVFVTVAVLCIAGSLGVALLSSTRERVIRLGHKPLAWTVALVVLALFSLAMTEVGNSLSVTDQAGVWAPETPDGRVPGGVYKCLVARQGDRFFVVIALAAPGAHSDWPMVTFRVDGRGQVADVRRASLPMTEPGTHQRYPFLTDFSLDSAGHLIASGIRMRVQPRAGEGKRVERVRDGLWQTRFAWPEDGPPEVLSHAALPLPRKQKSVHSVLATSWAFTERYAYLLCSAETLYVLDWSDGPEAMPRYEIPLPHRAWCVQISDGTLEIYDGSGLYAATFDADHPESLGTSRPWSFKPARRLPDQSGLECPLPLQRAGGGRISWALDKDFIYVRDRFGLRVVRGGPELDTAQPAIVGEYRASPLSLLMSPGREDLTLLDDSLLIEFSDSVGWMPMAAYDVSEPARPRRVGFFNRMGYRFYAQVFATDRHLVLLERVYRRGYMANLVATVFDKPK